MNKILFLGTGSISFQHQENIKGIEIDVKQLRERDLNNINLGKYLIEEGIRLAVVCTTSASHHQILEVLLQHKIPFYCEKPLFLNNNNLKTFRAEHEETLIKCCVGFNLRYHPGIVYLKKILKDSNERIGFQIHVAHDVTKWRKNRDYESLFSLKKELGGGAISELCHEIDFANYLFDAHKVNSVKSFMDYWNKGVDGQSLITLEGKNSMGSVYLDIISPEVRRSISCFSKNISLNLNLVEGTLKGIALSKEISKKFKYNRNNTLKESLLNFIDLNLNSSSDIAPLNNLYDCLDSSKLIAKAYNLSEI